MLQVLGVGFRESADFADCTDFFQSPLSALICVICGLAFVWYYHTLGSNPLSFNITAVSSFSPITNAVQRGQRGLEAYQIKDLILV